MSRGQGLGARRSPPEGASVGYSLGLEAFRQGLRELGYVEGQTIVIEYRFAEGRPERLPALAAEFVRLKMNVIDATSSPAPEAAKQATRTIPIVFAVVGNPVAAGVVTSVARPGGNITGLSTMSSEVVGKQLELLKEIVPKVSRVAVLQNLSNPSHPAVLREAEGAARTLGVQLTADLALSTRSTPEVPPKFPIDRWVWPAYRLTPQTQATWALRHLDLEVSMADPCAPLSPCNDLDGKLLIQRSVYGPQLAFDPATVSLAGLSTRGAALRGVLDLQFEVRWRSTGLCQAPATSVMGLAPGEVVTVGLRTRSTRTFSSLMRDAAESSRSSSHTEPDTGPAPASTGDAKGLGGIIGGIVSAIHQQAGASPAASFVQQLADKVGSAVEREGRTAGSGLGSAAAAAEHAIDLVPIFIGKFGSSFGEAAGVVAGALGAPVGGAGGAGAGMGMKAGNAISDLVDNVVGGAAGAGAGIVGTIQQIAEVMDTVERSESQSHLRETTVTTSTETEQTIQRTFGNPYLDRSLELRFMPVFHRYEITTVPLRARAGLATVVADPDPTQRPAPDLAGRVGSAQSPVTASPSTTATAARVRTTFTASVRAGDEDALRIPMLTVLQKATSPQDARRSVRLDQGLAWEQTDARASAVHVPLADADVVRRAWGLSTQVSQRLGGALARLEPDRLGQLFPEPNVRVVHMFVGVHVEAVPGNCVLPDIPEHLRVIVPGATQYQPVASTNS